MNAPNRDSFEHRYSHEHLQIERLDRYDRGMVAWRLAFLEGEAAGRVVADLGCGTGSYLVPVARVARRAIGVDLSGSFLRACAERLRAAGARADVVQAELGALPLGDASVDLAYSIATLYYVPDVGPAIAEAARVVRPGGRVLLELGNRTSLNTLVARLMPLGLTTYNIPVPRMRDLLREHGLRVDRHRAFQVLPMYGGPLFLRPLVTAKWKPIMSIRIAGQTLDERLSSLPLLRQLAFRHVFYCTKVA